MNSFFTATHLLVAAFLSCNSPCLACTDDEYLDGGDRCYHGACSAVDRDCQISADCGECKSSKTLPQCDYGKGADVMNENFRIKSPCKCGTHRNNSAENETVVCWDINTFCQPEYIHSIYNTIEPNKCIYSALPKPVVPLCPDHGKSPLTQLCNCGGADVRPLTYEEAMTSTSIIQYCDQGLYCTHQDFWTIPTDDDVRDDFRGTYCPSATLGDGDCFYCTESPLPRGIWSGQIGLWLLACVASTVVSFILSMSVSLCFVDDDTTVNCCRFTENGREACKFTKYNRRIPGCHPCLTGHDGAWEESYADGRMESCIPIGSGYNLPEVVQYCCCFPGCLVCGTCCCVLPAMFWFCWEHCLSMKSARRQRKHERRTDTQTMSIASQVSDTSSTSTWKPFLQKEMTTDLKLISAVVKWKDQGHGNKKGAIRFKLKRDGVEIRTINPSFGVAPHNWSTKLVTYEGSNSLLLGLTTGDIIIFEYSVGGGGGHKLYIKSFTANFCEAKKQIDEDRPTLTITGNGKNHQDVEMVQHF